MRTLLPKTLLLIAALALPAWAFAHTGNDIGAHHAIKFIDGLLHPFTGLDHLAAMLAVGLWSAVAARRMWLAPLAFASMLSIGALLGMSAVAVPAGEPMIAASLLVLGLMLASRARLPDAVAAALVGGFALFHGVAHGNELGGGARLLLPLLGMLTGTIALHIAGLSLGLAMQARSQWWPRVAGAAVSPLGGLLLVRMI